MKDFWIHSDVFDVWVVVFLLVRNFFWVDTFTKNTPTSLILTRIKPGKPHKRHQFKTPSQEAHVSGLFKWDPYWGDQTISKSMVILRDFPQNRAAQAPQQSHTPRKTWFSTIFYFRPRKFWGNDPSWRKRICFNWVGNNRQLETSVYPGGKLKPGCRGGRRPLGDSLREAGGEKIIAEWLALGRNGWPSGWRSPHLEIDVLIIVYM